MTSRGKHLSCRTERAIYCDRHHICWNKPSRDFLGSVGQFCAAFYHVPAKQFTLHCHCCPDKSQCKVGQRIDQNGFSVHPKTVVAVIKCEDNDGTVTYEARYSNCYDDKMHAEDYFKLDVEKGILPQLIHENKVSHITMYLTFQPCHMTVTGTNGAREDHSCCETLLTLFRDHQFPTRRNDIEICIKPAHIYKADQKLIPGEEQQNLAILNAAEGLKMLMREGIEVIRMDETDWEYLTAMLQDTMNYRRFVPPYRGSVREAFDREIGEVLKDLQMDITLEQPPTHKCDTGLGIYNDRKHILKSQDVANGNLLGKPGQICAAFYHIYEGHQAISSQEFLCFDKQHCSSSGKKRKLKRLYGPAKTMVVVVKCEDSKGMVLYEARYTDCYGFGIPAEDFFVRDARKGELDAVINGGRTTKITMYVTWPPRHKSPSETGSPQDNSCCETLVNLYSTRLKPKNINFSVKLAHVYKEGWPVYEDNVRVGIMVLLGRGIIVDRMVKVDWEFLSNIARLSYTCWNWGPRSKLDEEIGTYLAQIQKDMNGSYVLCKLLHVK